MNVLFCALDIYSAMGGEQRFNQRVLRALSEVGTRSSEGATALALWDGPEHRASAPQRVDFTGCGRSKWRMLFRFAYLLLARRPATVLYGHILLAPLAIIGRLLRPGAQHTLVVHGLEVWDDPTPLVRLVVRYFIDKVVSVSVFTARKMAASYRLNPSRFVILPNATDVEVSNTIADCTESGEFRLLTVARLTDQDGYKGHERVIRAMPQILNTFPDTHYYVVGDGPLKESLRTLAQELGVGRHVHLLGYVEDDTLEKLYASSHLFVLPSKKEGFGIVFLEAWKHRLPVIAGNAGASPEVVEHDFTGLIVDPDNCEDIAGAVVSLLADPHKRKQMGENGWRTLLDKYTHEKFRARIAQALN